MLILKIKDKGLYIEIPGLLPTRTPAEIDISKCDLSLVSAHLRKNGITNYEILSAAELEKISQPTAPNIKAASMDQKLINKRFSRLENMMQQLIEKGLGNEDTNSEQITNKLDKLEGIANKILKKKPVTQVIDKTGKTKKTDEPEIEELEDKFIPSINTSNMKMKGGSKKSVKKETMDLDDSVDLLSRIMGQDD